MTTYAGQIPQIDMRYLNVNRHFPYMVYFFAFPSTDHGREAGAMAGDRQKGKLMVKIKERKQ